MTILWKRILAIILLIAYHTSRYINAVVCTCQVLFQRKVLVFVIIVKTHGTTDLLLFMATTKCAMLARP